MRVAKFVVVGVGNTAIAFAVFNLLVLATEVPLAIATVAAWLAGFVNSYFWNRVWTFSDRGRLPVARVLPRFAVANLIALGVNVAVVVGLDRLIGDAERNALRANMIEAVAIGASLVLNYGLSSRWVFKEAPPATGEVDVI